MISKCNLRACPLALMEGSDGTFLRVCCRLQLIFEGDGKSRDNAVDNALVVGAQSAYAQLNTGTGEDMALRDVFSHAAERERRVLGLQVNQLQIRTSSVVIHVVFIVWMGAAGTRLELWS